MLRFASSPTGDMHIEDLRLAILNFLTAQQKNENFTVRIDDTNTTQNIEGKDTEIMQVLEKFALTHESVFHQSEHLHMHQTLAIKLLEQNKAFVCTCASKEAEPYSGHCFHVDKSEHAKLKESGTPFVIRIKKPTQEIVIQDLIHSEIKTSPNEVDSFVILNKDGIPTHPFASACDDMLSGVTFIIEKKANLLETAKQIHIKNALGYEAETNYAHLPAIVTEEDNTLVKSLFEQGFIPDAIINYFLLLGSVDMENEIVTLPDAITQFKLENISKEVSKFDSDKLRFVNRQHIRAMDDKQLSTLFGFADPDIGKLAKLYLEEVSTIKELKIKIEAIFAKKPFAGKWESPMRAMEQLIQDAPMFHAFDDFQNYMMKQSNLKDENFYTPLRLLLTGAKNGPELSDIYPFIKPYITEVAS